MKNIQYLTKTEMVAKFNEACASNETFTVSFYSVKAKPTHRNFASELRNKLFKSMFELSVNSMTKKDAQKQLMNSTLETILQENILTRTVKGANDIAYTNKTNSQLLIEVDADYDEDDEQKSYKSANPNNVISIVWNGNTFELSK